MKDNKYTTIHYQNYLQIDKDQRSISVLRNVHDQQALMNIDLSGRQADTGRCVHGFKHIVN